MTDYFQRGRLAVDARNMQDAAHWFAEAVKENPRNSEALASLGQSLCWVGKHKQGLEYLHKAGKQLIKKSRKNRDTRQLLQFVEQLQFWNDYQGSLEFIRYAVQINKHDIRGLQILAHTYSRLNKNQPALAASLQALKKAPDNAVLNIQHAMLESRLGHYDIAYQRLQGVLQRPSTSEEHFRAHKESANILDKAGQYERVFEHLNRSAEIAVQLPDVLRQNPSFVPKMLEAYGNGFTTDLLQRWAETRFPHERPPPVFLIGFFRSGTTLVQEVLDTHPEAFIADETDFVVATREELNRISGFRGSVPTQLQQASQEDIRYLREFYWDRVLNKYGELTDHRIFVDKTTMNTFDIGLINCIFPDAKVIFITRDPRDVCLSCFMQIMVPTPATIHLLSWKKTVDFYAMTMEWWLTIKERLTLKFIELRYEDAISNFQPTFANTFDFLGLEWIQAAHQFHKNAARKFISSPSYSQVSQPLYSSSLQRWRHYSAEFAPVITTLRPFIETFRYSE